ncbi:hypothetical protein KOW79_000131 [Hemibagrus wyckioides]|uniref:Uncharacterized protein n=1 Tax=Hemibagrus wyckioides TaxID=337641 RepID=A0A9D3P681_9TELE|nr:hypothetical protein KOW79_000131 [Hemibagrus wyckioides]
MRLLQVLFFGGLVLLPRVFSEYTFQCCIHELGNGSASYTLNNTIPEDWTSSWTKNGTVIVSEDGDMHEDYIVSPVQNGYILKERYSNVVSILESPVNGVSKKIQCSDPCNPSQLIPDDRIPPLKIIVIIIILLSILLVTLIGFLVKKRCRRSQPSTDVEMQDQDQDQNHTVQQRIDQCNLWTWGLESFLHVLWKAADSVESAQLRLYYSFEE